MNAKQVGDHLRSWIRAKLDATGATQTELARHLELAPSAVSRIVAGTRSLSAPELYDVADFFNTSASAILLELKDEGTIIREIFDGPSPNLGDDNVLRHPKTGGYLIRAMHKEDEDWFMPSTMLGDRVNSSNLRYFHITENSMSPLVLKGDIAIIDMAENTLGEPGLYAIDNGSGGPILRRLELEGFAIHEDATLKVSAENVRYSSQSLPLSGVRIIGRCAALLLTKPD